uniref:uncharacterized protein LOC100183369 isoform X2 n=1 Tax=Ciona intestinalis TaxID=7719 RepID=UPI000EF4B604|nr:uncharacterized protein LOC100183369 isoform X2 [Ciona intestinalis]|eukprot:XP_026695853.1 uncharacterized protein LOC100183369 isoform X2 [Ciona intestinalis]
MAHYFTAVASAVRKATKAHLWTNSGVNLDVQTVQIVTKNKDVTQVDLEAFSQILQKYKELPVAIISIFGDYRGGKSFLLNLLCQYLMQNQSDGWLKKNMELVKVFHWKGGVDGDTSGINITDKPFILENDKGESIAVFLMDTQGTFDKNMTVTESSKIFVLSTLLSSLQIYNLPNGQIRENDLQNLGQFLKHANTTAKGKGHDAAAAPLLPSLKFLVRNWQNEAEVGSKGGAEYLQKFWKANETENINMRDKITQGFTEVTCHLLPYPGSKVTKPRDSNDSNLKLPDLSKKFLIGVDDLGKCLFSKENLIVKQSNGKACTGKVLMQVAVEFNKMIENGKMPEVHTLMKVNEIVEFRDKIDDMVDEYVATMKCKTGGKYTDPTILEQFHEECFQNALKQFDDHDVLETDQSKKQCQQLKTNLNGAYALIQQKNDAGKIAGGQHLEDVDAARVVAETKAIEAFKTSTSDSNQDLVKGCEDKLHIAIQPKHKEFERINKDRLEFLLKELSNLGNECRMDYVEIMEEECKKEGTIENLRAVNKHAQESCVKKFKDSEKGKGFKCKEQQLQSLEEGMNERFQGYIKRVLQRALEEKRLKLEKEKDHLFLERKQAVKGYVEAMKDLKEKYVDEDKLHQIHETNKQKALNAYNKNSNNLSTEAKESFSENKDFLVQEVKEIFLNAQKVNKANQERAERIIDLFSKKVLVDYLEAMNKVAEYGSEPLLEKVHEIFVIYLKQQLEERIAYTKLRSRAITLCCRKLGGVNVAAVTLGWWAWAKAVAMVGALTAVIGIILTAAASGTLLGAGIFSALVAFGLISDVVHSSVTAYYAIELVFGIFGVSVAHLPSYTYLGDLHSLLYFN